MPLRRASRAWGSPRVKRHSSLIPGVHGLSGHVWVAVVDEADTVLLPEGLKVLKRVLLHFEYIQQRYYGMKLMAYTLINLRRFCST